ncbi:hypothetical protein ACFOPX_03135 [Helicobacter baculiformis]|uniref:Uncharacterized protein n=1 Tax=Helicobacter baculiformis TaxID=427351 RepID=A0ABV7ZJ93_9HELI|nr:hypothetical protein [Helicobacter baculiformis]
MHRRGFLKGALLIDLCDPIRAVQVALEAYQQRPLQESDADMKPFLSFKSTPEYDPRCFLGTRKTTMLTEVFLLHRGFDLGEKATLLDLPDMYFITIASFAHKGRTLSC